MSTDRRGAIEAGTPGRMQRAGWRDLAVLLACLAPTLLAIWTVPWFVTQDGPAHVYNAAILRDALRDESGGFVRAAYEVRWEPLPNWAGHIALMGGLSLLPPRAADRLLMTLTLIGPTAAAVWLRARIAGRRAGRRESLGAALLAATLGLSFPWLLGFYSFLIGATVGLVTLGVWWGRGEAPGFGPWRVPAVMALLALGYFCHPISLAATVLGLFVLALAEPGPGRGRRLAWTLVGLLPLVPLGLAYRSLMSRGGSMAPVWGTLEDPRRPSAWLAQLGWADPISLARKDWMAFVGSVPRGLSILAPVFWLVLGLSLVVLAGWLDARRHDSPRPRRGWIALAALLTFGGLLAPDTFGAEHGNYLPQRVVLLGLLLAVPVLRLDGATPAARRTARLGVLAVGVAWALQTALVWDYARYCERTVGPLARARAAVGTRQRVAALLLALRGPFRANPLRHAGALLGVGADGRADNVVWSNYEAAHYYFPVQPRPDVLHPPVRAFEEIAILDDPADAELRASMWGQLLGEFHEVIDAIVTRGRDDRIDAITGRWYVPTDVDAAGSIRVWRRRRTARRPVA
jgi:hypothetical protein